MVHILRRIWPLLAVALWASLLTAQQQGPGQNPFEPPPNKKGQKKPPPPSVAQKPPKGPPAPTLPPQVVVISLSGAGIDALKKLYEDGALTEDGFARFFQEGEVAEALQPTDPTLGAPNHVTLATGYPPAKTGVVGDRFHPAGAAPLSINSGFTSPIATETLWEAARRQKKRAALLAWPDTDQRDPRRRGDWGLDTTPAADYAPLAVTLTASDWHPAQFPAGVTPPISYSPARMARVKLTGTNGETQDIDVVAVDTTDNGVADYDAVVVRPQLAGVHLTPSFAPGEWMSFALTRHERATCWAKLLAIDPDLASTRLYFSATYRTLAYPKEFAAQLVQEDVAWPGPPDDLLLTDDGRFPAADLTTWEEEATRFAGFFGDLLRVAVGHRDWDLILASMPSIDLAERQLSLLDAHQEGFSPERRDAFATARRDVWKAVDSEIRRLAGSLDLQRTTLVVVSDHGLAPVHTTLDINARLRDHGLLKVGEKGEIAAAGTTAYAVGQGGVAYLYAPPPAAGGAPPDIAAVRQLLEAWKIDGESPIDKVMSRQEAADLGLDTPAAGDLIVFAKEGFAFTDEQSPHAKDAFPAHPYAASGYPTSSHPAMRAVYLALGAGIKAGSTAAVPAAALAPRVAGWLALAKPAAAPPAH